MSDQAGRRRVGLLMPLFACPSSTSWGIGEIGDLPAITAWLAGAGLRILQVLPINEMAPGQQSPYSAISAMALDPLFISLPAVPDFAALGGEDAMSGDEIAQMLGVPVGTVRSRLRLAREAFRRGAEKLRQDEQRVLGRVGSGAR